MIKHGDIVSFSEGRNKWIVLDTEDGMRFCTDLLSGHDHLNPSSYDLVIDAAQADLSEIHKHGTYHAYAVPMLWVMLCSTATDKKSA